MATVHVKRRREMERQSQRQGGEIKGETERWRKREAESQRGEVRETERWRVKGGAEEREAETEMERETEGVWKSLGIALY